MGHAQISLDGIYYNIVWRVNREINIHEPAPGGYWCLLTLWPIDGRLSPRARFAFIITCIIQSTRYYIIVYVYLSLLYCVLWCTGERDRFDAARSVFPHAVRRRSPLVARRVVLENTAVKSLSKSTRDFRNLKKNLHNTSHLAS